MNKKLVIAISLVIFTALGICGVVSVIGVMSTSNFQATASPTLAVLQSAPIETPIAQRIAPSLTPLPAQLGVRPSQTAYSLTRTAYPTDIAFYTSIVPTRPFIVSEGTATKFNRDIEMLQTRVQTHPTGMSGLCNDGTYTPLQTKQDACHYDGGIFDWWGSPVVK